MDGFAACRKIKEQKDIPVLMLSARGKEYDKLFGFEVGVENLPGEGAASGYVFLKNDPGHFSLNLH